MDEAGQHLSKYASILMSTQENRTVHVEQTRQCIESISLAKLPYEATSDKFGRVQNKTVLTAVATSCHILFHDVRNKDLGQRLIKPSQLYS